MRIGRPMDPATKWGPLVSREHREKSAVYLRWRREGAQTVVAGGGIPVFGDARDEGAYVQPTVWTGLSEQARCIKEEVFGPVCHVAPFDTEDEAIRLANDTRYGLAAAVWTQNLARGHRAWQAMKVGLAWVNCWFLRDLRTPFGGSGLSGIGREGGRHSLHFYTEPTNVCVKL